MKVQLLRSITSIQRALPEGSKLNSTKRNEIENSILGFDAGFSLETSVLEHTCAIIELGSFDDFYRSKIWEQLQENGLLVV